MNGVLNHLRYNIYQYIDKFIYQYIILKLILTAQSNGHKNTYKFVYVLLSALRDYVAQKPEWQQKMEPHSKHKNTKGRDRDNLDLQYTETRR